VLFAQSTLLVCHRHLAPTRAIISPAPWDGIPQNYFEAHVVSTEARFVKSREVAHVAMSDMKEAKKIERNYRIAQDFVNRSQP
jgi:hypothetical protein